MDWMLKRSHCTATVRTVTLRIDQQSGILWGTGRQQRGVNSSDRHRLVELLRQGRPVQAAAQGIAFLRRCVVVPMVQRLEALLGRPPTHRPALRLLLSPADHHPAIASRQRHIGSCMADARGSGSVLEVALLSGRGPDRARVRAGAARPQARLATSCLASWPEAPLARPGSGLHARRAKVGPATQSDHGSAASRRSPPVGWTVDTKYVETFAGPSYCTVQGSRCTSTGVPQASGRARGVVIAIVEDGGRERCWKLSDDGPTCEQGPLPARSPAARGPVVDPLLSCDPSSSLLLTHYSVRNSKQSMSHASTAEPFAATHSVPPPHQSAPKWGGEELGRVVTAGCGRV